ncbi:acyltransferase [Youngiibacter multivorans]|uniref:Acetyltransferase-like isoleucine patch superfamily enzyme n=1 Tax=Youngiibacter multivorans TaxID=937251 RepID=A0ABS4G690_9CLOT|nr:acyltransferase [Youngiibacter multivorans]MBP1920097.1 acetyltransferase-like isoleucine patch superfamily enzyme [Youngiibacter multivorans]
MKLAFYFKKAINMYSVKFWTPINKISFTINGIKYNKGLRVRGKVYYIQHSKESSVEIGSNVFINSAPKANPIGFVDRVNIQMVDSGKLIIGDNCGISNCAFTCSNQIQLGNHVLLGAGCKLFDTDFHALDYHERIKGNYKGAPIKTSPIIIEEGVFVGAGSIILKGVTIGRHSIIGAGSVVTKNIPPGEVWAGNPATFVRKIEEDA